MNIRDFSKKYDRGAGWFDLRHNNGRVDPEEVAAAGGTRVLMKDLASMPMADRKQALRLLTDGAFNDYVAKKYPDFVARWDAGVDAGTWRAWAKDGHFCEKEIASGGGREQFADSFAKLAPEDREIIGGRGHVETATARWLRERRLI
jgi:hypothetical protein